MDSTTHVLAFSIKGNDVVETAFETTVEISISVHPSPDLPSPSRILDLVRAVSKGEEVPFKSIGIILSDHETVLELNQTWLEHDYHTDVLSFLIEDDPDQLEGEVYVDVETAQERHAEFKASAQLEIERYIVHGLLHLAGHNDATDIDRAEMQRLEDTYLAA